MRRWHRFGIGFLIALVLVAGVTYAGLYRLGVLPRLDFAPGWSLTDATGERLTSEDLRGAVVLYTFTYTRAEDTRRQSMDVMRAVQERLRDENLGDVQVRLVTISFDAEHDTPATLRRTAEGVGADSTRWQFATGDAATLRTVVRDGFGVYYEPQPDGHFAFDPVYVLVDGWGIVRARYRFGRPAPDDLLRAIRSVVREVRAAEGAARYAYEAAHLFSCYSTV